MDFLGTRSLRYFDWASFALMLILSLIGLVFVFSATYRPEQPFSVFFTKQCLGFACALGIYTICALIDYRTLERFSYLFYFFIIGLLTFTLFKGSIGMGAQRWISVGIFKFQPSELAKLFFPPFVTYYLTSDLDERPTLSTFIPLLAILAISTVLVLKQPDLGTALILFFSGFILLWLAGLSKKFFLWFIIISAICTPLLWHNLKPYQKQRIAVFLGQGDSKKERYQIEQSHIAVGGGGLFGKGFLQGTQNKFQFLPESRTDFIFSVLCEEMGFIGALGLLLLYFLFFSRLVYLISTCPTWHMQLLASGLVIHIILSALINLGMVLGLLPIVGIPLPLMSYGLTNLWITYASLGWFNGIMMKR